MISESGERAVVIAPSALGSKDHPAGPFQSPAAENPPGDIPAVEDPSAESGGEVSVASFRTRQSPEFPEHGFQKQSLEGEKDTGFQSF